VGYRKQIAVLGAVVALLTAACGGEEKGTATTGTPPPTTVAPATGASGATGGGGSGATGGSGSSGTVPTVQAGINDPGDHNIAVLQFMPAKVTVKVNSPLRWDWTGTTEPHSVTFLKPGQQLPPPGSDTSLFAPTPATGPYDGTTFVYSGLQPLGPAPAAPLEMTFSTAGTYSYFCVIHPQMVGTVEVVATGGDTVQQVNDRKASEQDQWLREGRTAKTQFLAGSAPATNNPDGTKTYRVAMGTSTAHTDILAFQPTPVGIKAGDRVQFVNNSGAPHTASFFGKGATVIQDPTDPRTDAPAPGPSPQTLSATGFFNTGLLPPNAPPGAGPPEAARSFTFVVPTAGSYNYVCILHAPSVMVGVVNAT
jgi:plastocyanin